jgi:hypothetical protein
MKIELRMIQISFQSLRKRLRTYYGGEAQGQTLMLVEFPSW